MGILDAQHLFVPHQRGQDPQIAVIEIGSVDGDGRPGALYHGRSRFRGIQPVVGQDHVRLKTVLRVEGHHIHGGTQHRIGMMGDAVFRHSGLLLFLSALLLRIDLIEPAQHGTDLGTGDGPFRTEGAVGIPAEEACLQALIHRVPCPVRDLLVIRHLFRILFPGLQDAAVRLLGVFYKDGGSLGPGQCPVRAEGTVLVPGDPALIRGPVHIGRIPGSFLHIGIPVLPGIHRHGFLPQFRGEHGHQLRPRQLRLGGKMSGIHPFDDALFPQCVHIGGIPAVLFNIIKRVLWSGRCRNGQQARRQYGCQKDRDYGSDLQSVSPSFRFLFPAMITRLSFPVQIRHFFISFEVFLRFFLFFTILFEIFERFTKYLRLI